MVGLDDFKESRTMILYILDLEQFEKSEYCEELPKHKKHHVAGQFLIRLALGEEAYNKAEFAMGEHGKPYMVGEPIHYNISHSGQYVVLVTANSEVGVDIQEKRSSYKESVAKRFFSDKEWKDISKCESEEDKKESFYRIWCRKESYGKYLGTGLSTEVLQTNVLVDVDDVQWIEYEAVNGYQLCICNRKGEHIEKIIRVFEGL